MSLSVVSFYCVLFLGALLKLGDGQSVLMNNIFFICFYPFKLKDVTEDSNESLPT